MAFFTCKPSYNTYNTNASFTPLLRFLDDFDNYSRHGARKTVASHWQPKFDIRETEQAFELHAELPGVSKDDVQIKFTDHQTILIAGKTQRSYTTAAPAVPAETATEDTTMSDTVTEGSVAQSEQSEKSATPSHQATVEDDFEDIAYTETAPSEAEHTEAEEEEAQETEPEPTEKPVAKQPVDQAKYWLTERSVGQFARSFQFPTRVDQDAVSASFTDGILSIVVPKAKKHEARRITISYL